MENVRNGTTAMLSRDREKLNYNHKYLVQELNVEHFLLYLSGIVLTKFEVDKIYSIRNPQERTKRLLNIIQTKGPLAFIHFKSVLQERYPHVIAKLDATPVAQHPNDDNTTTDNKKILVRRQSLVLNLKPDDVIKDLVEEGVLSENDKDKLRGYRTNGDKSRALIDMLPHRGSGSFKHFVLAVRTNQPGLADLLETAIVEVNDTS